MPRLVQIIYVSHSTFSPQNAASTIEPSVARILAKSRVNNRRDGLVGVLYFGNGCFFQCLQGEEEAVDKLYARIKADPRHKDVKVLSRKTIPALTYAEWAMKFAPAEKEMPRLLREGGYKTFDPYKFDEAMIARVLGLLSDSTDPTSAMKAEELVNLAAQAPNETRRLPALLLGGAIFLVILIAAILFIAKRA